jgi:2'-5' RNA ligase
VAWVAADNFHVTLKFLGEVAAASLPQIEATLGAAAAPAAPFTLGVRGLGAFPSPARARVIWAGAAEGAGAAIRLAARVEEALEPLGFVRETRPFVPHVTLGRAREPRRRPALAAALAAGATREFGRVAVARVSLMRSALSPRGSRYTELRAFELGGAAPR